MCRPVLLTRATGSRFSLVSTPQKKQIILDRLGITGQTTSHGASVPGVVTDATAESSQKLTFLEL